MLSTVGLYLNLTTTTTFHTAPENWLNELREADIAVFIAASWIPVLSAALAVPILFATYSTLHSPGNKQRLRLAMICGAISLVLGALSSVADGLLASLVVPDWVGGEASRRAELLGEVKLSVAVANILSILAVLPGALSSIIIGRLLVAGGRPFWRVVGYASVTSAVAGLAGVLVLVSLAFASFSAIWLSSAVAFNVGMGWIFLTDGDDPRTAYPAQA